VYNYDEVNFAKKIQSRYRYSLVLLKQLVITDFKLRYKSSALGYLWSMLKPLLLFLTLYIVFVKFLNVQFAINDPAIYLLVGIVLWGFFNEVTTGSIQSIVGRGDILRKINFPKYIVVISVTVSALINLGLSLVVVFVFMIFGNAHPIPIAAIAVPLLILELFMFAIGIGFFLSATYVKLRDVNYVWEVVLQAGFYATPIIYPIARVAQFSPEAAKLLLLNPVAQVIQDVRYFLVDQNTVTTSSIFDGGYYRFIPVLISILVFILGALYFRKRSSSFAENL